MTWQQKLEEYESHKKWQDALAQLSRVVHENPDQVEPVVRLIYLIHNLLVEEDYEKAGFDYDQLSGLLIKVFKDSMARFHNNAEYAFFVGIIMHIAEWHFGENDETAAIELQKTAMEMEPSNLLYELSYRFSISDFRRAKELADKLDHDKQVKKWLELRGFPGRYVLGILEAPMKEPFM
jgi:tetratricopeptide (TPR) repeat protein